MNITTMLSIVAVAFSLLMPSRAESGEKFTFTNKTGTTIYVAVHHMGCMGVPNRDWKPMCWSAEVHPDKKATYEPSNWVTGFDSWIGLIAAGLTAGVAIVVTAGVAAPEAATLVFGISAAEGTTAAAEGAGTVVSVAAAEDSTMTTVMSILGKSAVGFVSGEAFAKITDGWGFYVRPDTWANMREPRKAAVYDGNLEFVIASEEMLKDKKWFICDGCD